MINEETKEFLDYFEGVDDGLYNVYSIEVLDEKTMEKHVCLTYFLDDFNEDLLRSKVFFENYSSINSFYGEYKKSQDTPENVCNLLKEIKRFK